MFHRRNNNAGEYAHLADFGALESILKKPKI